MMGLSSLNDKEKKTIRQSSNMLDIQTANGIAVSDTQAQCYHWEDDATILVDSRLSKGKKVIECCIESFVPMVPVSKQSSQRKL